MKYICFDQIQIDILVNISFVVLFDNFKSLITIAGLIMDLHLGKRLSLINFRNRAIA